MYSTKFFTALVLVLIVSGLSVTAATASPTIEQFASPPDVSSVILSPDGKSMASLVRVDTGEVKGQAINILNVDTKKANIFAATDNKTYRYLWLNWLNNQKLLMKVSFHFCQTSSL